MKTSEHINELASALAKAQGELQDAAIDSTNPHFKNDFASLSSTLKTIRPVFSKYGLSVVQGLETEKGPTPETSPYVLNTRLMHASGQWIETSLELLLSKQDMQGVGSANTYARRYTIQTIAGINQEKDDDGNMASLATTQKPSPKTPPPPPLSKPRNETPIGANHVTQLVKLAEEKGMATEELKEFLFDNFKITTLHGMKIWQYDLAMDILNRLRGAQ
jgi:hypothetical protein